jgi:hypothetical protein
MRKVYTSRTSVTVYFDRDEAAELAKLAGAQSLSSYIRRAVMDRVPVPTSKKSKQHIEVEKVIVSAKPAQDLVFSESQNPNSFETPDFEEAHEEIERDWTTAKKRVSLAPNKYCKPHHAMDCRAPECSKES